MRGRSCDSAWTGPGAKSIADLWGTSLSNAYGGGVIEARHLRVLRAVARGGSFSAAARALGCTQPAVSQQMKALEASAGTPLLVRGPREMRLTQAGEALVRHADGILAGLAAAEEEVA